MTASLQKRANWLKSVSNCSEGTRILDIGASPISEPPYKNLLDWKLCALWGFEPQTDAFDKLQRDKSELEEYFPLAVGDGNDGTYYDYRAGGFSSLFRAYIPSFDYLGKWKRAISSVNEIDVATTRLDDVDGLPNPHLVKIDIQGGELGVFKNGKNAFRMLSQLLLKYAFSDFMRTNQCSQTNC